MKSLKVKRVGDGICAATAVTDLLNAAGVEYNAIDCVNWPESAPYLPDVKFRIAHTGTAVLLEYTVSEDHIRAMCAADNGAIWQDSCVEFFVSFGPEAYYNLECNCAGLLLCGAGAARANRVRADRDILSRIDRCTTVEIDAPFDSQESASAWKLCLSVPVGTFFMSNIDSLDGLRARANFYKCGDCLPKAHYVSWAPISFDKPNFHLPQFFGELIFE